MSTMRSDARPLEGAAPSPQPAASASRIGADDGDRLFVGTFPTGLVYADRWVEEHGDYRRLAYLNYRTLELDIERSVPAELKKRIVSDAEGIRAMAGTGYAVAGNQYVVLGSAHMAQLDIDAAAVEYQKKQAARQRAADLAMVPGAEAIAKRARVAALRDLGQIRGSCDHAVITIVHEFAKAGIAAARTSGLVKFNGRDHHHTWAEVGQIIVDATLDQFGEGLPEIFIGRSEQAPVYYAPVHRHRD
jgi:hypothetical protein